MKIMFFDTRYQMSTLGMPHVSTYLESMGYPVKYVFLSRCEGRGTRQKFNQRPESQKGIDSIIAFIKSEKPDLIGMSLMMINFFRARFLLDEIKKSFIEIPILWGGIHPTFDPQESLDRADYVCVGEGEQATLEFVKAIEQGGDKDNIPNIWVRKGDRAIKNDVRPLINELDAFPFPRVNFDRTFILDGGLIKPLTHKLYRKYVHYNGTVYDIIVSRGCPNQCAYCCNSLFHHLYRGKGGFVRYRSVDNVIEELRYVRRTFPYVRVINIQDDSFAAASEEYLEEFCTKYKVRVGLPMRARAIASQLTDNKVKLLAEANTMSVIIGIQANDRINKTVFNRHISSESFLAAAKLLKKYNIVGEYQLIGSNPYSTEQDMVDICDVLSKTPKPYRLQLFNLGIFPHTGLWERAVRDGISVNKMDGYAYNYGSYPEKFPLLRAIQEASPYTPSFLIRFFIKYRKVFQGRLVFYVYKLFYINVMALIRYIVLNSTWLVLIAQKIMLRRYRIRKSLVPVMEQNVAVGDSHQKVLS